MLVFFQAEDGIRDLVRSRGLGDVYKRQEMKLALLLKPDKLEYLEQLGDIYQKSDDLEQALYQLSLIHI